MQALNGFIMTSLRNEIEKSLIEKKDHTSFKAGDTITVYYKIKEGEKERTQFWKASGVTAAVAE